MSKFRRQLMMVNTPSVTPPDPPTPVLPYDAEVEWLESDGYAYIDTGVNLKKIVVNTFKASFSQTTTTASAITGVYYNATSEPRFQIYIDGNNKWGSSTNTTEASITGFTKGQVVSLNSYYTIKCTAKKTQNSDASIFMFARNTDNNAPIPTNGMRLYYCQMTYDGVLARDFIPVRVGQVGYLYDKVSGELFGNANSTGAFSFGIDVTT